MSNSSFIGQYAMIPPGALGAMSEVRRVNCSTVGVLPPSDTHTLPGGATGTAQDVQAYHYSQNLCPHGIVAEDSNGPSGVQLPMKAACIHTVNPLSDRRWDELVARHPKASAFHQRSWLEALARTYGYEPVVFTTSSPTAELENGLVFCRIKSWLTGNRLVSLPFSDHCEPICDSAEEMNSLICGSQTSFDFKHGEYLEVRPTSEDFGRSGTGMGFHPAARYFLHLIDLRPDVDELFRGLDKDSVQRRIKRAEKAGLVERCGSSDELLRHFYVLLVVTRNRHHLPPAPYAWFQNLLRCQGKALEIRVAYLDEIPIAAILTLRFRQTCYFKYGCSDARFNKFAATPWLLWRAIVAAKSSGALEFDLGRTQADNAGLLAFKNHWVARGQELTYWKFPGSPTLNVADDRKLRMAKRVFSHMPQRLLVATGRLVYRHIG
jgi:Acetyltransferase (GNAT) domain